MTPNELLAEVRSRLAAAASPEFRDGLKWYFKEAVDPYGVRTPEIRRIAAAAYREVKHWPAARRDRFASELWKSGKLEEGSVAVCLYQRFRKKFSAREFLLFERWIDRYVRNWAHCDGVASWLLAACLANDPSLIPRVRTWTVSQNRWKRRAAAVALLQEAKQGRNAGAIADVAGDLIADSDDMVQKGVGWLLKETYPKRPREVMTFLVPRKDRASRLLLRIAAEKMTAGDRARLLDKR